MLPFSRSYRHRVGATAVLAASLLSARGNAQSEKAAAAALFTQGTALQRAGDAAGACAKFEESHRVDPTGTAAAAVARCKEAEGKTATAWTLYLEAQRHALRAGYTKPAAELGAKAAELEPNLARLTVVVPQAIAAIPGLTVKRDGLVLGQGSWGAPLPVDPGPHVIEVAAPGKKPFALTVPVLAKTPASAMIGKLEDEPAAVGTATSMPARATAPTPRGPSGDSLPPAEPADPGSTQRTVGLVVGGIGIAAVVFGTAELMAGRSAQSKIDAQYGKGCVKGVSCDDLHALETDRDDKNRLALLGLAGGVLAMGGGVALVALAPRSSRAVSLQLAPGLGGLRLAGTW